MNKGRMTALLIFAMAVLNGVGERVSHATGAVNVINNQLAFQGFLQTAAGAALNGTYKMKFQIMKNAAPIWQKVTTPSSVTVTNGVFSYLFTGNDDSAIPLTGAIFATTSGSDVFTVTVQVNVTQDNVTYDTFSAMPLTASPTAMVADYANQALGIQGYPVSAVAPVTNQVMAFNGGSWIPTAPVSSVTMGGDVTGASGSSVVGALQGVAVSTSTPGANNVLTYTGGKWTPAAAASVVAGSGIALSGSTVSVSGVSAGNMVAGDYSGILTTGTYTLNTSGSAGSATNISGTAGVTHGGTGLTAVTAGQIPYGSGPNTYGLLSPGSNGNYLQWTGGVPAWGSLSLAAGSGISVSGATISVGTVGVTSGGTGITGVTAGELLYGSAANTISALPTGTNGQYLTLAAGVPSWGAVSVTSFNGDAAYVATAGTSTAYTLAAAGFTLATGAVVTFKATVTSGAAPTLSVNSTTATAMYLMDDSAALPTGTLVAGGYYRATYNGTHWDVESANAGSGGVTPYYATTAGTATAYTLAQTGFLLAPGATVTFKANATSTGAATLSVNGTTAANLFAMDNSAAIPTGGIVANQYYKATYNGTNWLVESRNASVSVVTPTYAATAGTTTAYTLAQVGFVLVPGAVVTFKANATSTGAATLAVNGTTATNLFAMDNSAAIPTGGIVIGNYYRATYNGTNWLVENVSQGLEPAFGGSNYTATGGTGAAETLALPGFILTSGALVRFKLTTANTTTTATLAVGASAPTTMTNIDGTALVVGQLVAGQYYQAIYNGTNWLVESAVRYLSGSAAITTQSPTATAPISTQTVTVNGAVAGDPVYCSPSVAMTATTISWVPYVSAANTVTIQLNNTNTAGATGTPTFKCVVIKSP